MGSRRVWRALAAAVVLACVAPAVAADGAPAATTWLCRPGGGADPCDAPLATARFTPSGQPLGTDDPRPVRRPAIDCFYVYPTVSDQPGVQASRRVDPELRSIALYQAARYRRHCRVFAPVYRQLTLRGIGAPGAEQGRAFRSAYADVLAAWREYLRRFNRGRGVVLIGHSQGTGHLTRLVRTQIDRRPPVRRRLVSAILLGGNVTVRRGSDAGGSFREVRACRSATQTGCVVAFSTFGDTPPPNAIFGRANNLFASFFGVPAGRDRQVLCTSPAAFGGGEATLQTEFPSAPFAPGTTIAAGIQATGFAVPATDAPWIAFPGAFTGRCSVEGGVSVLRVTPKAAAAASLRPVPDATWGLHLIDANVALGDLVDLVGAQARAYARRR